MIILELFFREETNNLNIDILCYKNLHLPLDISFSKWINFIISITDPNEWYEKMHVKAVE